MRFGFHAINLGALATPGAIRQIVAACERYQIDSLWTGDHVINATTIASPYPYSPTGTFPLRPARISTAGAEPITGRRTVNVLA